MTNKLPPCLTVVTPTYKRPHYLEIAMRSVLEQGYKNLQYIVVDDASNDDTPALVERLSAEFPHSISYVANPENLGESASLNKGWQLARGDYVLCLSDDDVLSADWCKTAISFMEQHPNVSVAYADWNIIDANGEVLKLASMPEYSFKRLTSGCICMPGPGTIIRRSDFKNWPMIRDSKYRYVPDMAMWMRFAVHHTFARMPFTGAGWRVHAASISCSAGVEKKTAELIRVADDFIHEFHHVRHVRSLKNAMRSRVQLQSARLWLCAEQYQRAICCIISALKISLIHTFVLAGCYGKRVLNEWNIASSRFLMTEYIK